MCKHIGSIIFYEIKIINRRWYFCTNCRFYLKHKDGNFIQIGNKDRSNKDKAYFNAGFRRYD